MDPTGEVPLIPIGYMVLGMLAGGGIEVVSQISQGAKCINWKPVALSAAASISPAGRFGYKATLLRNKKLANTMDRDGAYYLRAQIKSDFRLFKPIDNLLRKRDKPKDKINNPIESFAKTNAKYDIGLTAPGAATIGANAGNADNARNADECNCN